MVTTKQVDEIIDAVLDRIEITGSGSEPYPDLSTSDRNELISIITDIIEE